MHTPEGSLVSNEKKPRKTVEIDSHWLKSTQGPKIVYEVLWQTAPCAALWLSTGTDKYSCFNILNYELRFMHDYPTYI